MPKQGYFLSAADFRELEAITARLAHFASVVFDQTVDADDLNRSIDEPPPLLPVLGGQSDLI